jgi:hypothetical protein
MDILEVIATAAVSVGGSAAVFGLFGNFFTSIISNKINESQRAANDRELARLQLNLDLLKSEKQRISDERFGIYSKLWGALQDLGTLGDMLWERVDLKTLDAFRKTLVTTRQEANRSRLVLKEPHFRSLCAALDVFSAYQVGKARLLEIRSSVELKKRFREYSNSAEEVEYQVQQQIRQNQAARASYKGLLEDIINDFRSQLGLSA